MQKSTAPSAQPVVVIPNLNGGEELLAAVESLQLQTVQPRVIVVDNASTDGSVKKLQERFPDVELIQHLANKGYAGGVNPGFRRAIELGADYVAPFNDDAIADPQWLQKLVAELDGHPEAGAAACKVLQADGKTLDSVGDYYTNWGLAYPNGRGEADAGQYDQQKDIFAASGAASLYRVAALQQVGLLDEAFFAYYEDVDLSFRLQLAGWKVRFVPESRVYHKIGMTSGRVKGFTTHQTLKNLPVLLHKNVPGRYYFRVAWRLRLALILFFARAVSRGQFWPAFTGAWKGVWLIIIKTPERRRIQRGAKMPPEYIWSMMVHDLPPNAGALRKLRAKWWQLRGRA